MARKGRARRFREARALKQGFDDGLFSEGGKTLADLEDQPDSAEDPDDAYADEWDDAVAEDDDDPLKIDERNDPDRRAS